MTVTGNEDHSISLNDAAAMTKRYRDSAGQSATIAHLFGKTAIQNILNQDGCKGIRIYYGFNELEQKQLIITGVDCDGNDLYEGLLAERSFLCPSSCSSANPLNTTPVSS